MLYCLLQWLYMRMVLKLYFQVFGSDEYIFLKGIIRFIFFKCLGMAVILMDFDWKHM